MTVMVKMVMKKMMVAEDKEERQILSWASHLVFGRSRKRNTGGPRSPYLCLPQTTPWRWRSLRTLKMAKKGELRNWRCCLPRMGVGIQGKFPGGGNLWTEPSWTSLGIRRGSRQENGTWKGERGWAWQVAGTPLPVGSISVHPRWTTPPSTWASCAMWSSGRPCRRKTGTVSFSMMWTCSQRMTTTSIFATSSLPLFHGHWQVQL